MKKKTELRLMTRQEMGYANFAEWAYGEAVGLTDAEIESLADRAVRDARKEARGRAPDEGAASIPDRSILVEWLQYYRDNRDEEE
ncbi:MAG: hypothetical protein LKM39_11395 [Chiayiivirga sp.]|jgi:hypothetical protein|nr:hypothetical protein [Chiayiivirga sp.]